MRGRPAHRETYMYNPVNLVRKPTKQIAPDTDLCGCYQEHNYEPPEAARSVQLHGIAFRSTCI